jgi:hypothetical protein
MQEAASHDANAWTTISVFGEFTLTFQVEFPGTSTKYQTAVPEDEIHEVREEKV